MPRYVCKCHHYLEDISDLIEVEARDLLEAIEKAHRKSCGGDHECMENTSCHCEQIEG